MRCIFYDKDGKELFYDIDRATKCGQFGQIYKVSDDKCIKIFDEADKFNNLIADVNAFTELMNIDSNNFYKIYKLLYADIGYIEGYLMKYYYKSIDNILEEPMEYLLDNFNRLYEVTKEITKKKISMDDLHSGNLLLTKDDIVINDADNYQFDKSIFLMNKNKKKLYNAFMGLLYWHFIFNYGKEQSEECRNIVKDLFRGSNSTKTIHNKLRSYKKPIDYFKNNLYK